MEVSAQHISVPDLLCCQDNRKRMMELQERRRSLQVVLSNRLAELRCLCLQEAELTGNVPSDYPLETEEPPPVRRSIGFSHDKTATRPEEEGEVSQRCKLKKTLFIKRTVHRGCHTDDTVVDSISDLGRPLPLPPRNGPITAHIRGQLGPVGGASGPLGGGVSKDAVGGASGPLGGGASKDAVGGASSPLGGGASKDAVGGASSPLGGGASKDAVGGASSPLGGGASKDAVGGARSPLGGGASKDAVQPSSSQALSAEDSSRLSPSRTGQVQARRRAAEYGDLLQEYVWGKQHKLQLQTQLHSNSRQPIVCQMPPPPTLLRGHPGEPGRVKVTRTKSCGPFLSPEPPEPPAAIQPDPHPHLLPPRPPQPRPTHDPPRDPARTLHKALALEGLRDWYLRNTSGSAQQTLFKGKGKGNGPNRRGGGGRAPQCTQTAHGVIQRLSYQRETSKQAPQKHPIEKQHLYTAQMQHSVTFHGQALHGRSAEGSLYQDFLSDRQVPPLKEPMIEQGSPGTLV